MKNIYIYLELLIFAIITSGCPKLCIESVYSFKANSQIVPDLDSIGIGDTMYIISTFPMTLLDQISGKEVEYNNAPDIESTLSIAELASGDSIPVGAVYDFSYTSEIGRIYNSTTIPSPETVQQLKYQEMGSNYQLKIGLIPKRKGIFALGIGNGLSNGRGKSKRCEKASFNFTIFNTSQHIFYYKNWRPSYNLSPSDTLKLYCFKVY